MKYCAHCKTMLALDAFGKQSKAKDGKQGYCKPCKEAVKKKDRAAKAKGVQQQDRDWVGQSWEAEQLQGYAVPGRHGDSTQQRMHTWNNTHPHPAEHNVSASSSTPQQHRNGIVSQFQCESEVSGAGGA